MPPDHRYISSLFMQMPDGSYAPIGVNSTFPKTENEITIFYQYDTVANVWTATSEDIPGLVLEGEDLDELKERVKEAIPELISINL